MEARKDLSAEDQQTGLIEGGFNLAMSCLGQRRCFVARPSWDGVD
jgi:hypothetical protein